LLKVKSWAESGAAAALVCSLQQQLFLKNDNRKQIVIRPPFIIFGGVPNDLRKLSCFAEKAVHLTLKSKMNQKIDEINQFLFQNGVGLG